MRLSEREKRYVAVLAAMMFLAGLYFYYTLVVEPYHQKRTLALEEQAALSMQLKSLEKQLDHKTQLEQQLQAKTDEAMAAVAPFFPGLPQDRVLLMLQDMIQKSGLQVTNFAFSPIAATDMTPKAAATAGIQYRMGDLARVSAGIPATATPATEANMATGEAAAPETVLLQVLPSQLVSISYQGNHDQVAMLIQLCEQSGRTICIDQLDEAKTEEGLVSGTIGLHLYAVDKPAADAFLTWDLADSAKRSDLFQHIYQTTPQNGAGAAPADTAVPVESPSAAVAPAAP